MTGSEGGGWAVYERHWDFFGSRKKQQGFFAVAKKGQSDNLGYAKKVVTFWVDKFSVNL